MIEVTDGDIAKALRSSGFPGHQHEVDAVRDALSEFCGSHGPVAEHARTIAKLRIATKALEYAHVPTSETWFVVHDALAQIKDTTND